MKLSRSAILKAVLGTLFLFLSFVFSSNLILLLITLAAGILLLVDGLGIFEKGKGGNKLTILELTILEMLSRKKGENEIAEATGVSPPLISKKIGKLFENGYITDGKYLTEKGFEALHQGKSLSKSEDK